MKICPVCKNDITDLEKQYGDIRYPICQSCFLSGDDWVYDDPDILENLERGLSLKDAMGLCVKEEITDLQKFAEAYFESFVGDRNG